MLEPAKPVPQGQGDRPGDRAPPSEDMVEKDCEAHDSACTERNRRIQEKRQNEERKADWAEAEEEAILEEEAKTHATDAERDEMERDIERQEQELEQMNDTKKKDFGNLDMIEEDEMEAEKDAVQAEMTGGYDLHIHCLSLFHHRNWRKNFFANMFVGGTGTRVLSQEQNGTNNVAGRLKNIGTT